MLLLMVINEWDFHLGFDIVILKILKDINYSGKKR